MPQADCMNNPEHSTPNGLGESGWPVYLLLNWGAPLICAATGEDNRTNSQKGQHYVSIRHQLEIFF